MLNYFTLFFAHAWGPICWLIGLVIVTKTIITIVAVNALKESPAFALVASHLKISSYGIHSWEASKINDTLVAAVKAYIAQK